MNESKTFPGLSRRGFLAGAAGVTAATMLPSSSRARAAVTPIAGATVDAFVYGVKNSLQAANIFDGYVSMPLAVTIQKFYATAAVLAQTQLDSRMKQLAQAGCKFLVDVRPSKALSSTTQSQMASWLAMLNNAGISYEVVLYSGSNNAFTSPSQWFAFWSYYAPVVRAAGVACGYSPGCAFPLTKALQFFPSNPTPDQLWMDYYGTGFRATSRLEPLIAVAQSAGVTQLGLGEWGWSAGAPVLNPMTIPWWNEYCNYLIHLSKVGHLNLGAIYFGGESGGVNNNVISSPSDPRIPGIKKVSATVAP